MSTKYIKNHCEITFLLLYLYRKIQFMQSICFSMRSCFYLLLQLGCLLRHKTVAWLTCVSIKPDVKYILIVWENTTYMFYPGRAICYDCVIPKATPLNIYNKVWKGLVHRRNEISCCQELPSQCLHKQISQNCKTINTEMLILPQIFISQYVILCKTYSYFGFTYYPVHIHQEITYYIYNV